MLEQTVTLASASGLHARPAAVVVQKAKQFDSTITLHKGEHTANAKSMLKILTLGAEHGDDVLLQVEGADAEDALAAMTDLLRQDLG